MQGNTNQERTNERECRIRFQVRGDQVEYRKRKTKTAKSFSFRNLLRAIAGQFVVQEDGRRFHQ